MVNSNDIQLVLMDVMMPQMDGITAMAKIRESSNVPVIMLTAKSEDTDKVLGLEVGADDYVTKPFNPVELLARVKSQLRRYMQLGGGETPKDKLVIGGIELDDKSKQVALDGELMPLTPTEYDILKLLMQNVGKVFSTKEYIRRCGRRILWSGGRIRCSPHKTSKRKDRDKSFGSEIHKGYLRGRGYRMEGK